MQTDSETVRPEETTVSNGDRDPKSNKRVGEARSVRPLTTYAKDHEATLYVCFILSSVRVWTFSSLATANKVLRID